MARITKAIVYSNEYIEKLFQYWYTNNAPSSKAFEKIIFDNKDLRDEHGRTPSSATLDNWFTEMFRPRKDLLDAKVATQIDDDLVALKVNMLREQAAGFRAIRQKAQDFLLTTEFDSSSAAVQAFIKSAQEERIALGLSKTIQKLAEADDDSLLSRVRELAAKVSGSTIDADDAEVDDGEA